MRQLSSAVSDKTAPLNSSDAYFRAENISHKKEAAIDAATSGTVRNQILTRGDVAWLASDAQSSMVGTSGNVARWFRDTHRASRFAQQPIRFSSPKFRALESPAIVPKGRLGAVNFVLR
jgi:hypothetical protein